MQRQMRLPSACLLAIMLLATTGAASGASVEIVIAVGDLAGRATFSQDGQDFVITLENIALAGATVPSEVLTGVYFDLLGLTTTEVESLVRTRAELTPGSVVINPVSGDGTDSNGEVGGEYGFRHDLPSGHQAGMVISAVGLGDLIGTPHLFQGEDLWGPPSEAPDGLAYGIVSAVGPTANAKVTDVPLVQNGVIFTLSGLPQGFVFDETKLQNVALNYGTDYNVTLPLPAAVWGGMALLGGMGVFAAIRRKLGRG